jgi:hypothetical protein
MSKKVTSTAPTIKFQTPTMEGRNTAQVPKMATPPPPPTKKK